MPGFLPRLLKPFLFIPQNEPQDSPHSVPQVTHRKKIQLDLEEENLPILEKDGIILMQSIVGEALYFGRIMCNAMLVAINEIGHQ